jgi:hypothetical protein
MFTRTIAAWLREISGRTRRHITSIERENVELAQAMLSQFPVSSPAVIEHHRKPSCFCEKKEG